MKISQAKEAYSNHIRDLTSKKQALTKLLNDNAEGKTGSRFDSVEISKELSMIEKEYEKSVNTMQNISTQESMIMQMESAKQEADGWKDVTDDMIKCLEIARRISSGGKVPAADEKMLMEYSNDLYMAAKNMAFLKAQEDKEYDQLYEEREEENVESPDEIAGNTEIAVAAPEAVEISADMGDTGETLE